VEERKLINHCTWGEKLSIEKVLLRMVFDLNYMRGRVEMGGKKERGQHPGVEGASKGSMRTCGWTVVQLKEDNNPAPWAAEVTEVYHPEKEGCNGTYSLEGWIETPARGEFKNS